MNNHDPGTLLEAIRAANLANDSKAHDVAVRKAVHTAFESGATVAQIAEVLGIHQPHATRKYGPFPDRPKGQVRKGQESRIQVALAAVGQLHAASSTGKTEDALLAAIAAAREAGITWQAIADVLGKAQPNVVAQYRPQLEVRTTTEVTPRPKERRRPVVLTVEQRAELRRRAQAGESVKALAAEFGASESYIRNLRNPRAGASPK